MLFRLAQFLQFVQMDTKRSCESSAFYLDDDLCGLNGYTHRLSEFFLYELFDNPYFWRFFESTFR